MIWTEALPYFPRHELACKGTGIIKMDIRFAVALPALRVAHGKPLTPTSVCRAPEHNASDDVKGHPTSLHLTDNPKWPTTGSMAADIFWASWPVEKQMAFACLAWAMGWSVGLHNTFCHIDRRKDLRIPELPQHVFIYGAWDNRFTADDVVRLGR